MLLMFSTLVTHSTQIWADDIICPHFLKNYSEKLKIFEWRKVVHVNYLNVSLNFVSKSQSSWDNYPKVTHSTQNWADDICPHFLKWRKVVQVNYLNNVSSNLFQNHNQVETNCPKAKTMGPWLNEFHFMLSVSQNVELSVHAKATWLGQCVHIIRSVGHMILTRAHHWQLAIGCEPKVLCISSMWHELFTGFYVKLGWNWNRVVSERVNKRLFLDFLGLFWQNCLSWIFLVWAISDILGQKFVLTSNI
jgi:hypothetical protein